MRYYIFELHYKRIKTVLLKRAHSSCLRLVYVVARFWKSSHNFNVFRWKNECGFRRL